MSTDESNPLEFQGKDLKECERFIAAVNKHARAQGKLRDDQWIADFVAVCLAEDALIWWSLLDEETQGSWRLLRQAMISRFRPVFYGKSGAEAEDFVHQIRQRALHVGKLDDPAWIAKFASGCFVGSALRWYSLLDSSVQGDWNALQRAIFMQYTEGTKGDTTAQIVPTAPLAAAPPVPPKHRQRGRIRVGRKDKPGIYYFSKIVGSDASGDQEARIMITSVIAEALEVEYKLASADDGRPQALTIPDDQIKGCDQLGMMWYYPDTKYRFNFLAVCGVNSTSGTGSPGSAYRGPLLAIPWKISSSWNEQGARSVTGMSGTARSLFAISEPGTYNYAAFRETKLGHEIDLELFFEPV